MGRTGRQLLGLAPDPDDPGRFDAFNINTWSFRPAPTPWYRTRQAVTAIIAASAAMAAIVVSAVLLVFRGQGDTVVDDVTSSVTPTAPTSAAPVQVASSEAPPPPLPPPPPPETASPEPALPETASPANTAPPQHGAELQPDVPTASEQGAGDRSDAHADHPVTDQRRAAAAGSAYRKSLALLVPPGQHVLELGEVVAIVGRVDLGGEQGDALG